MTRKPDRFATTTGTSELKVSIRLTRGRVGSSFAQSSSQDTARTELSTGMTAGWAHDEAGIRKQKKATTSCQTAARRANRRFGQRVRAPIYTATDAQSEYQQSLGRPRQYYGRLAENSRLARITKLIGAAKLHRSFEWLAESAIGTGIGIGIAPRHLVGTSALRSSPSGSQ